MQGFECLMISKLHRHVVIGNVLELQSPATKGSLFALYNNRPMAFVLGDHQLEQQTTRAITHYNKKFPLMKEVNPLENKKISWNCGMAKNCLAKKSCEPENKMF